jgi:diguanylate cyclase (GGDEF)-like protein
MTGYADAHAIMHAVNTGRIWSCVEKPVGPEDLRQIVEAAFEVYRVCVENRELTARLSYEAPETQHNPRALGQRLSHRANELSEINRTLRGLAIRDPVTGLHNHRHFHERLKAEIMRASRREWPLSVLLLDLDSFRRFNDGNGHRWGDAKLRDIGELLSGKAPDTVLSFRESDLVARYGPDVFAVLLTDCSKAGALKGAERARRAVELLGSAEGNPGLTASVGVAQFPTDARSADSLVECAEQALYKAKREGRNRIVGFSPGLLAEASEASQLPSARALESVIRNGAFTFLLQPVVDLESFRAFGYEALCRATHPRFPDASSFFGAAERLGYMPGIGHASRKILVERLARWDRNLNVFVNLHPDELRDASPLIEQLEPVSQRVILEITETADIGNFERVGKVVAELKQAGFRVALDDFGAGYSGINRISRLSPDLIKLDIELVRRLRVDVRTERLVSHLLDFAHDEDIGVVAEGIEEDDELERVIDLGFTYGQGYLLGRPEVEPRPPLGTARRRDQRTPEAETDQ